MPDAAAADPAKERAPDTTPASDKEAPSGAGAAATSPTPTPDKAASDSAAPSGVGDMAIQRKAEVGRADDALEKEADATAQRVMRATEVPPPAGGAGGPVPTPAKEKEEGADGAGTGVVQRQTATGTADPPTADAGVGPAGGPLPPSVQAYLDNSAGEGHPLPEATLRFFEQRFEGAQFADVRVHDDAGANEAARVLGAVAFTRGNDIYFGAGMYDPVSEAGRTLLAHELTHVVQQRGRGTPPSWKPVDQEAVTPDHPDVVRRSNGTPPAAGGAAPAAPTGGAAPAAPATPLPGLSQPGTWSGQKGTVNPVTRTMSVNRVRLPNVKVPFARSQLPIALNKAARTDTQRTVWDGAAAAHVDTKIQNRLTALSPTPPPDGVYRVRWGPAPARGAQPPPVRPHGGNPSPSGGRAGYFFGALPEVQARMRRPPWDRRRRGTREEFDVDHRLDWQLGGTDAIGNLWLLEASTNRSYGSTVSRAIDEAITEVLTESAPPQSSTAPRAFPAGGQPAARAVRQSWDVQINGAEGGAEGPSARPNPPRWELNDLAAETFDNIEVVQASDLEPSDLANNYVVFFDRTGGRRVEVVAAAPQWQASGFKVHSINPDAPSALIEFYPGGHPRIKGGPPVTVPIQAMPGIRRAGFLNVDRRVAGRNLVFNGLSPIEMDEVRFDPEVGIVGGARIPAPTVPMLRDVEIGLRLNGGDVEAYATIAAGSLKLPGPFQVTGGALELAVGMSGFSVYGDITFEIRNLAQGRIFGRGNLGANSGFAVGGELQFDSRMFTQARLGLAYANDQWSVTGELGVGEGKIAGIKSATARVAVEGERVSASGTFESSLRGLERGQLSFNYDPATGAEIAGTLGIGRLPGIEGGTIDARVRQRSDGQGYSLSGGVTARPSIPGVTGSITGRFEDGAFFAEANLGYQRGMLNGRVRLGITNQVVTDGRPAGPPTPNLTAWGGGEVTIRIAPWLQGTIGLELDPQGRMTVRGRVALPNELTFFDEKRYDRNIFSIGIDIPIVGVAVLGQRIGIFATIRGGLDASAGIGPGKLRELALEVEYSPDDEAATRVHGRAAVHVPAHAGLRLFVQGGIGAGIPVVSATAGLEVSGALGLEGAAQASVDVNWTPSTGLAISADGSIFVEPKFRFAITGFVNVSADLWIDTVELYNKRWELAAFEYGSNLRFGVEFPIRYQEGQPFELSLDQVRFVYPSIDANELMRGLISRLA